MTLHKEFSVINTARRAFQMLENTSLWELAGHVHGLLGRNSFPHAIVGGVAVCLHGYRRNTVDLDLLIAPEDTTGVKLALEAESTHRVQRGPSQRSIEGLGGNTKAFVDSLSDQERLSVRRARLTS